MNDNKKTILITGGAGALGSNLCKRYVQEGCNVICLDNLQKTIDTKNINSLMKQSNFRFVKHDIVNPISFKENIDWVINMACPVSCIDLQVDPIHTARSTVDGVINMLEVARKHDAVFMQASSADIYGEKKAGEIQKETDWGSVNTLSPRACYEEGKRMGETICMDYYRMYGTKVKIPRIFNTSGPGTHISDGRVISNFIFAALQNRDLVIYGDGSATRSFLYMDDILDALDKFMKTPDDVTGPINIGNVDERTILELAETIIKVSGSRSKIIFTEADDAPMHRRPDISLAKKILDWEPTTSFEDNIRKTVEYYKTIDLPDKRILVFATTFYPDVGPAERALMELARQMPGSEFHIVTSRFRKGLPSKEIVENITIFRIGVGSILDKFGLLLFGALKAFGLHKENQYKFMWSIMPSYGGIAGRIMKFMYPKISFIVTDEKVKKSPVREKFTESIKRSADKVYLTEDSGDNNDFAESVRYDYAKLLAKQEGKLERPR